MGGNGSKCIGDREGEGNNRQNVQPSVDKVSMSVDFSGNKTHTMNNFESFGGQGVNSTSYGQNAGHLDKDKSPMPEATELERRFTKVLVSIINIKKFTHFFFFKSVRNINKIKLPFKCFFKNAHTHVF